MLWSAIGNFYEQNWMFSTVAKAAHVMGCRGMLLRTFEFKLSEIAFQAISGVILAYC